MTKYSISTTITKLVGPDAEDVQVPVTVEVSITPPDRSVGINNYGWEDIVITDNDGNEIEVDEATTDRLGDEVVKAYITDENDTYVTPNHSRHAPSEFYD